MGRFVERTSLFVCTNYLARHWCDVTEWESFEDEDVVPVFHVGCVSIKWIGTNGPDQASTTKCQWTAIDRWWRHSRGRAGLRRSGLPRRQPAAQADFCLGRAQSSSVFQLSLGRKELRCRVLAQQRSRLRSGVLGRTVSESPYRAGPFHAPPSRPQVSSGSTPERSRYAF